MRPDPDGRATPQRLRIDAVAIGVPARNESVRVDRCIDAIARAARACPVPVVSVLAADCCDDDTYDRAHRAFARHRTDLIGAAIAVGAGHVGRARQVACTTAVRLTGRPAQHVWLATTDADTAVAPDWLVAQLRWADAGLDAVAGMVDVDDDAPAALERALVEHLGEAGIGHPHVFGANLGVRAEAWLGASGFPPLAVGEDHGLWTLLRERGATVLGVPDVRVVTSGRRHGRAPGGFASVLSELLPPPPAAAARLDLDDCEDVIPDRDRSRP